MKVNVYTVINSIYEEDKENEIILTRGENSDTVIVKCKVPLIAIKKNDLLKSIQIFEEFDKKGEIKND